MFLVDSHCHFDLLDHDKTDDYIKRAQQQDVKFFLNVCVKLSRLSAMKALAEKHAQVAISVGLHPNDTDETVDVDTLIQAADHPKVVAIGETGLDYYRSSGDLSWQHERFRAHIHAAKTLGLPLIIHTRQAKDDTMRILKEEHAEEVRGVMHCFSEDIETAKLALDLGFYISFSGIVTFKNAHTIQTAAKALPIESILIETDSPYLAPMPHRGKPNEPAYVRHVAEYIAELKHISLENFAEHTTHNFFNLFHKAKRPHV